jgi:septum formation protein
MHPFETHKNDPATHFPYVVLASSSPRRVELLKSANIPVVTRSPEVDESPRRGEAPAALVRRLARLKALSVVSAVEAEFSSGVVLSADTIVVSPKGNRILGKPRDRKDAEKMLKILSGKTHTVLTGYCLSGFGLTSEKDKSLVRVIKSSVTLRKLDAQFIADYVGTGEPMDKAGSYAAQGLGMTFIEKISGSYTNVVGLPISQVLEDLAREFGIHPRF